MSLFALEWQGSGRVCPCGFWPGTAYPANGDQNVLPYSIQSELQDILLSLCLSVAHKVGRLPGLVETCQWVLTLFRGPRTLPLGPLLKGCKTSLTNSVPVVCLVVFQQPVAHQQLDAAFTDLYRSDHDNAVGATLTQAPRTEC